MINKVRYIKFSPDEYIAGVGAVLDAEQQGVYWMICSMIYSNGGDIPNDPKHIGRLVCLGSSKARRIINHLISIGKITENQSFLSQKRVVIELETARNRTETATKNGSVPKNIKHLARADALFSDKLTNNHKPLTINQEPKVSKKGSRISEDWKPSEANKEYAISKGFHNGQIQTLADKFLNYWLGATGKNAIKLDWDATWRNKVINEAERLAPKQDEIGDRIR